jgi:hypothetical protein
MPMNPQGFALAFSNENERDQFFDRCAKGVQVRPGTALSHVLACHLGLWGDEQALKDDAARIMNFELASWADANGEKRLNIPDELIMRSPSFRNGFDDCRAPNRHAMNKLSAELISAAPRATDPAPRVPTECTGIEYTAKIYFDLCKIADQYGRARRNFEDDVAGIGYRR